MTIEEKFAKLGVDNAPGQEVRRKDSSAKLTGGGLGGCVIALVTGESATRRVRAALEQTGAPETWSYRMRISEVDE